MASRSAASPAGTSAYMGSFLGYLSVLFNCLLSLALLGVGLIASFETSDLNLTLVPEWAGSVTGTVLTGGLAGLTAVALALRPGRASRSAHLMWSVAVAFICSGAFWKASYRFDGLEDFRLSALLFGGYLLVVGGSWLHFRAGGERRRP